jgi:hypothetical protein
MARSGTALPLPSLLHLLLRIGIAQDVQYAATISDPLCALI